MSHADTLRHSFAALLRACVCLFLLVVITATAALAQRERAPLVLETPGSSDTSTAATADAASDSRLFGRTVVVMLGGVSWREWSRLSASTSTATPFLRRILEEGGLGAAWLPAADRELPPEYSGLGADTLSVNSAANDDRVSRAMLRAVALLSAGRRLPANVELSSTLSQTLGIGETLSRDSDGFESSSAALAFARRTDRAPRAGNLVNLGWGDLAQRLQRERNDNVQERDGVLPAWPVGALGAIVHGAGGKTAAIGNSESSVESGRGARLREAAVIAVDENGLVDRGDVSAQTLARDKDAPFGVRANSTAYVQALDRVFADPQTALVALEWGDTRRAARYARYCVPEVAAAHKQVAFGRLNAFTGEVLKRLTKPNDRLIIICVPELDAPGAQLLPVVFWRPQRGGQGAILTSARSETRGLIGLENIHAKIAAQLGGKPRAEYSAGALPIDEIGGPSPSSNRIESLIALGSGLDWLSRARPVSHAVWCLLFIGAAVISLWALNFPSERLKGIARILWCATMIAPWILWLAGLCVETTWRFGVGNGASWKLSFALVSLACLMWFLTGATFNWFSRARVLSTRVAVAWLILTVLALWIGAFALPLNSLLHRAPVDASTPVPRAGDVWALLLVSATLLGLAGLTRVHVAALPDARKQSPVAERDAEADGENRRAINLRPALLWAIAVIAILWAARWGANPAAAFIALIGLGAMYLRLWLERATREHRLRVRRVAVGIVVAIGVLLLWQRGGSALVASTLAAWWPQWLASWSEPWWSAAFLTTVGLALGGMLPRSRVLLRDYLSQRFSRRAMLGATAIAAVIGVLIVGPSAAPLLTTFTIGAVVYEALR